MESEYIDDMKEERFRVRVCLQHYFSDHRSQVYVSVVRQRQVHWLQQRLQTLFALRGPFYLHSRGHFLPPEEPLSLLQPDDPVEVIPLSGEALDVDSNKEYNGTITTQDQEEKQKIERITSPTPSTGKESSIAATEPLETEKHNEALLLMKRQALSLLECCAGDSSVADVENEVAPANGEKPRRTRRRVRRRKRRLSDVDHSRRDLAQEESAATEEATGPEDTEIKTKEVVMEEEAVLRNVPVATRKPRIVHSVSPPLT
ncbi:unnamed protein product [Parnassius mnemosyne]|uniref:Coilin N-terminal domain-containing protein n=1 Tax=Parnassius mnemosyne TaxID=213953 RepID=A0AAV1KEA3_9NEOP